MPEPQTASRFAYYDQPGPARDVIKLGTRSTPNPGPGAVLVRVRMSGVNPSDTKRRAGWASYKPRLPRTVLHCDGAGEIIAVGDGVPPGRIGERVWLWNAESDGEGAAADHCVLSSAQAPHLPDIAAFDVGACLGVPACTAHRAVFADGPVEGQTILVHGAAGSVAAYAIQFAVRGGARVLVTGSTPAKRQFGLDLGAVQAFDYRAPEAAAQIMAATGGAGVQRIVEVDLGQNLALDLAVAAVNGTIASYSSTRFPKFEFPYYAAAPKGLTFQIVQGFNLPERARAESIAYINAAITQGWLRHHIGAVFPLEQIADAHEASESGGLTGKVLVSLG